MSWILSTIDPKPFMSYLFLNQHSFTLSPWPLVSMTPLIDHSSILHKPFDSDVDDLCSQLKEYARELDDMLERFQILHDSSLRPRLAPPDLALP